jgi:hypothetical protein
MKSSINLIIVKINFLKQDTGFTGMGLFKMNSITILSVFALILRVPKRTETETNTKYIQQYNNYVIVKLFKLRWI